MFIFSLLFLDKKKVPGAKILRVRDDDYRGATLFQKYVLVKKQKADIPIGISATNSTFLDPIRRVLLSISFPCNVRTRHPLLTFALHLANPFPKNYLAVSHHPGSLCRIELRYSFWSSILFIRFLIELRLLLLPGFVKSQITIFHYQMQL